MPTTTLETRPRPARILVPILVLGGVIFIFLQMVSQRPADGVDPDSDEANRVSAVTIFGRVDRRFVSPAFEGGDVVVVMGAGGIDLRQAQMSPGGAELGVLVLMGRANIRVPEGWRVVDETAAVMGKVRDKRLTTDSTSQNVLRLQGVVLMGRASISH